MRELRPNQVSDCVKTPHFGILFSVNYCFY